MNRESYLQEVLAMSAVDDPRENLAFYEAYIGAMEWTDLNDDDSPSLEPVFELESMVDCTAFLFEVRDYAFAVTSSATIEQMGHDFWLTRQGHGSGFWDRPYLYGKGLAERLTTLAEEFGPVDAVWEHKT
jgi:hypothetical protein